MASLKEAFKRLAEANGDSKKYELKKIIKQAQQELVKWGGRHQLEMAQEEATELALAIRRHIRYGNSETFVELSSEIADVEIMIEQMKSMFKDLDLEKNVEMDKDFKINRLFSRLNKRENEG